MDEFYSDHRTFKHQTAKNRPEYVALTGLLVPAGIRSEFRDRFYRAVGEALDLPANTIPPMPQIHGSSLFPDRPDDVKLRFLEKIAKACVDLELSVVRSGYYWTPELKRMFPTPKDTLGPCFLNMLWFATSLKSKEVWPVIETDQSAQQDRAFAGAIQTLDYVTTNVSRLSLSVDNSNLGEVLYCSKRSIYGTVVDLVSYLLDARFLTQKGFAVTEYKENLARIAARLNPIILRDEIIEMAFEGPPDHVPGRGVA
ncbi:hypothetical protein EFB14_30955 [Rhizobium fabae]|nr:hypothetical protein EFB14_30955 [Rhizobium fabae]